MRVAFTAEIDVPDEELTKAEDDTMQAIQNMIGHTGAQVGSIEHEDT